MSLRRNTLLNLSGQVATVAVSLLTVPPFLRLIGNERYGALLIVWVLFGYFALFDLGVSQATTQRMALLRDALPRERARLLWTALIINVTVGIVAGIILFVLGRLLLGRFVSVETQLLAEALHALPWVAFALPFSMAASVFSGAVQGREAFGAMIAASTFSQAVAQGIPLFVAWRYSVSLEWLIPAALVARVLSAGAFFAMCRRLVPLVGAPRFDPETARRLYRYGSWITISSIIGPLMSSLDRLLIGALSGSEAVTYYGVPQGLAGRVLMLPSALSGVLMPRLAATQDEARASIADTSIRVVSSVMTPGVVAGIFVVEPFLTYWISPSFAAVAAPGARILFIGVWFNAMAMVAHSALLARGSPDAIAKIHLIELPLYFGALAVSLRLWGVTGAAIAWSARVALDAVLLYSAGGLLRRSAARLVSPLALCGAALVTLSVGAHNAALNWTAGLSLLLLSGAWSYRNLPSALLPLRRTLPAGSSS